MITNHTAYLDESWVKPGTAEQTTPTHTTRLQIPSMLLLRASPRVQLLIQTPNWQWPLGEAQVIWNYMLQKPHLLSSHQRPCSYCYKHQDAYTYYHTYIHWGHSHSTPLPRGMHIVRLFRERKERCPGFTVFILRRKYALNVRRSTRLHAICNTKPPGSENRSC